VPVWDSRTLDSPDSGTSLLGEFDNYYGVLPLHVPEPCFLLDAIYTFAAIWLADTRGL
jgi:hypothetical protein